MHLFMVYGMRIRHYICQHRGTQRQLRFAPEPAPETAPLAGLPSPRPRARTGSCLHRALRGNYWS